MQVFVASQTIGSFSRKSGFTVARLLTYKQGEPRVKRDLKYIGKTASCKEDYDYLSIEEVMKEIEQDLTEEFGRQVTLYLTSSRGGKISIEGETDPVVEGENVLYT